MVATAWSVCMVVWYYSTVYGTCITIALCFVYYGMVVAYNF